jgi:hypothetical protein
VIEDGEVDVSDPTEEQTQVANKWVRRREDYNGLHAVSAQFVAITAVIAALALPLLSYSASLWTRIGVSFALAGTVLNGIGFMVMGLLASGHKDEQEVPATSLYWGQMGVLAFSVILIGLSLVLVFIGQWNRH